MNARMRCKEARIGMKMGQGYMQGCTHSLKLGCIDAGKGAKMECMDAHTHARMGCKDKVHAQEQRWDAWMHTWG